MAKVLGYSLKDVGKEYFKVVHINAFHLEKNADMDECLKFDAIMATNNHLLLGGVNIILVMRISRNWYMGGFL